MPKADSKKTKGFLVNEGPLECDCGCGEKSDGVDVDGHISHHVVMMCVSHVAVRQNGLLIKMPHVMHAWKTSKERMFE